MNGSNTVFAWETDEQNITTVSFTDTGVIIANIYPDPLVDNYPVILSDVEFKELSGLVIEIINSKLK